MNEAEFIAVVEAMANTATRAVKAGVDMIATHTAHEYLVLQFFSPVTDRWRDKYGRGFENNSRILIDMLKSVRPAIPADASLFVRLNSTDWLEETEVGQKHGR